MLSGRHRQWPQFRKAPRTRPQCPRRRAARRTPWSGAPVGWKFRCRMRRPVPTAAGGWACMDGRRPARPPCPRPAQGCGRVRGGQRPSAGTLPRCPVPDTCWVPDLGRRSRRTSTVRTSGQGRGLWTLAARRCPALRTLRLPQGRADIAAMPRWTAGSSSVHRHPKVRPATEPQGAASASTAMASSPGP
jgi:hypothetical protein